MVHKNSKTFIDRLKFTKIIINGRKTSLGLCFDHPGCLGLSHIGPTQSAYDIRLIKSIKGSNLFKIIKIGPNQTKVNKIDHQCSEIDKTYMSFPLDHPRF